MSTTSAWWVAPVATLISVVVTATVTLVVTRLANPWHKRERDRLMADRELIEKMHPGPHRQLMTQSLDVRLVEYVGRATLPGEITQKLHLYAVLSFYSLAWLAVGAIRLIWPGPSDEWAVAVEALSFLAALLFTSIFALLRLRWERRAREFRISKGLGNYFDQQVQEKAARKAARREARRGRRNPPLDETPGPEDDAAEHGR